MPRLGVIELNQLPAFTVLETISSEAILAARMANLVTTWNSNDPPNAAQYDVGALEFDPIKINQETNAFFETTLRDRVNQAARAVTLAYAVGGALDAIASRYPGGMPRIDDEDDEAYRTRIWLSPNTFSRNGIYESYVFFALTAAMLAATPLRDATAVATPGFPDVTIAIAADGAPIAVVMDVNGNVSGFTQSPSPVPSNSLVQTVASYITAPGQGRKGLTDVISVGGPSKVILLDYKIRVLLYPGWDRATIMNQLAITLVMLLDSQRYLGFSHMVSAIEGALKVSGVFNVIVDSPADTVITATQMIVVNSIALSYAGRGGIGPLPPDS